MTDATMAPTSPERDWMTPEEFRTWFERLKAISPKMTHARLGEYLEVTQPTITRWMSEKTGDSRRRIEHGSMLKLALERLEQKLIEERRPKRRQPQTGAAE
jgi:hypothetical protein